MSTECHVSCHQGSKKWVAMGQSWHSGLAYTGTDITTHVGILARVPVGGRRDKLLSVCVWLRFGRAGNKMGQRQHKLDTYLI